MSSNYSIGLDKGQRHEDYVRHIFRYLLSGPNSTFNFFIARTNYDWGAQEQKYYKETSFRMLLRSTITW